MTARAALDSEDCARPGLRVGKVDALAANPVPFKRDDFTEAASGQHQQADALSSQLPPLRQPPVPVECPSASPAIDPRPHSEAKPAPRPSPAFAVRAKDVPVRKYPRRQRARPEPGPAACPEPRIASHKR